MWDFLSHLLEPKVYFIHADVSFFNTNQQQYSSLIISVWLPIQIQLQLIRVSYSQRPAKWEFTIKSSFIWYICIRQNTGERFIVDCWYKGNLQDNTYYKAFKVILPPEMAQNPSNHDCVPPCEFLNGRHYIFTWYFTKNSHNSHF